MDVPAEYQDGREQTWFKHQVLKHYLRAWSQKLASVSRLGRRVRLWYVDCFAGPWESRTEDRTDTSVAIGIGALEEALETWAESPAKVEAAAIFVEKEPTSAARLRAYLEGRSRRRVTPYVLEGEFGAQVETIGKMLGGDAAFLFVDPTGWKGAAMKFIAPLAAANFRDVLVNVMFHHINRWKGDSREFLRQQMKDMFGLGDADLPSGMAEDELMGLYRRQLKVMARLPYAADLAVPHPSIDRTFFRLVVGGHHSEVVGLFRDIEEKVVGRDAGAVRPIAKARARTKRTGQVEMVTMLEGPTSIDARYRQMRDRDRTAAILQLVQIVSMQPKTFGDLWPTLLEDHHITRKHLADSVLAEVKAGRLGVMGMQATERTVKDNHVIFTKTMTADGGSQ